MASRFNGPGQPYDGLAENGRWTGVVRLVPEALGQPLRWKKPRRIFVNSMSDLFHESLSDADILSVFRVMLDAHNYSDHGAPPGHTFQVLTKRPARMRDFCTRLRFDNSGDGRMYLAEDPISNRFFNPMASRLGMQRVWLGVSVENQATADERIPELLQTPAAVHFVSYEPALGPADFSPWISPEPMTDLSGWKPRLSWIIAGGESGPGARPAHPDWFRSVRDQCREAGVAFHFKQWGEWAPLQGHPGAMKAFSTTTNSINDGDTMVKVGKAAAGRLLDGRTHDEFPDGDR